MKTYLMTKGKKAQVGLDIVKGVIMTLLILGVLAVAVFLALTSLQNSGIFTAGSTGQNNTNAVVNNITGGTVTFFTYIPTIMSILAVVVIIAAVAILIFYVKGFEGRETAGGM